MADSIPYQRARFAVSLPVARRYHPAHFWLEEEETPGFWRVGLTKFATRMIGEIVDYRMDLEPGSRMEPDQAVGWVEGFKALTEIHSVVRGVFLEANPQLAEDPLILFQKPMQTWIYRASGEPDGQQMDVHAYAALLDETIDRMQSA